MSTDAELIAQATSMIRAQDLYGWSSEHDRVVLDALDAFSVPSAEGIGTTPSAKAPAKGTSPEEKAPVPKAKIKLTKADTRALWYAVYNSGFMVRALAKDPGVNMPAQVQAEKDLLLQAKRALRKVNALRKGQQP